jgi:hypothetical protein
MLYGVEHDACRTFNNCLVKVDATPPQQRSRRLLVDPEWRARNIDCVVKKQSECLSIVQRKTLTMSKGK